MFAATIATILFVFIANLNGVHAHGGAMGEVEFAYRSLYSLQDVHRIAVVQTHAEESHLIIAGAHACDDHELEHLHGVEDKEYDHLEPNVIMPVTANGGFELETEEENIYTFQVNFTSNFVCWKVLHSDAIIVYIVDEVTGTRVEPLLEMKMEAEIHRSAEVDGQAAAAVVVVCVIPLLLVLVFLVCSSSVPAMVDYGVIALFMQSFGCGALLSAVVLHIYPEVVMGLEESHTEQWRGGALVLGAICMMITVQLIVGSLFKHDHDLMDMRNSTKSPEAVEPATIKDIEDGNSNHGHAHTENNKKVINYGTFRGIFDLKTIPTVVWGLTLGDSMHNLVDGAAIATAFLACGTSAGWIITAGIVAHEIPQELGDLVVMMTEGATLKQACFFNVLAQLTALLGMGIVMSLGSLNIRDQALMMSFGLGTFLYIALCNIMPKLVVAKTKGQLAAIVFGLVLAFVVLGLTTMMEEGC